MREEKGRAGTHSSMKESLSKEETGDYVNSSVIVSGSLQSGRTLLSEQTSSSSIVSRQDDSGLGSEDKSWGGELLNLEGISYTFSFKFVLISSSSHRREEKESTSLCEYAHTE